MKVCEAHFSKDAHSCQELTCQVAQPRWAHVFSRKYQPTGLLQGFGDSGSYKHSWQAPRIQLGRERARERKKEREVSGVRFEGIEISLNYSPLRPIVVLRG